MPARPTVRSAPLKRKAVESRCHGPRRGLQLLRGKEPRGLRRGRSRDNPRREIADRSECSGTTANREVLPRDRRLQRQAGRDPGRHTSDEAQTPARVERKAPPDSPPIRRPPRHTGRPGHALRTLLGQGPHTTFMWSGPPCAAPFRIISHERESPQACTIPFPSTFKVPTHAWDTPKAPFRPPRKRSSEILSLPMYPELTPQHQEAIAGAIEKFISAT